MKWPRSKKEPDTSPDPQWVEPLVLCLIWASGMTSAGMALFLGKIHAAMLIGVVCLGVFIRFKRGRIRKS